MAKGDLMLVTLPDDDEPWRLVRAEEEPTPQGTCKVHVYQQTRPGQSVLAPDGSRGDGTYIAKAHSDALMFSWLYLRTRRPYGGSKTGKTLGAGRPLLSRHMGSPLHPRIKKPNPRRSS